MTHPTEADHVSYKTKGVKMTKLSLLRSVALGSCLLLMAGQALADDPLTVISWGGAYQKSQEKAYFEPFTQKTGVKVLEDEWDGSTAKIKGMVESKQVIWDIVDVETGHALQGCAEGWLEKFDY